MAPPFASTKASLAEQSRRITTLPVPVQRSSNNSLDILKLGLKQMDNSSGISFNRVNSTTWPYLICQFISGPDGGLI